MKKNELKIYLASQRGFCAGVDREIEIEKLILYLIAYETELQENPP